MNALHFMPIRMTYFLKLYTKRNQDKLLYYANVAENLKC